MLTKTKMTRTEKTLFGAPLLALILFLFAHWIGENYTSLPFQTMRLSSMNQKGVATLQTDAYSVAFEGHAFGAVRVDNEIYVDGRYGTSSSWEPWAWQHRIGVQMIYSQANRLFTIKYSGHQLDYSRHRQTLNVDGQEYSTADGPIHLLIKKNGEVVHTSE